MLVLVTGGAGFIGSHSVKALLARGAKVRVLDNLSTGRLDHLPCAAHLEVLQGDVRDTECVERAMRGATHVLHLAAQVSVPQSVEQPLHSHSVNVTGFVNVLDAARRNPVQRLVYASTAAVYGVPAALPLSEESGVSPLSPYGLEKLVNDHYAALYSTLYGMLAVGLRYFNVYGPNQDPRSPYSGVISKFAEWALAGEPLLVHGDGSQTRDFVYVGDVARANAAALQSAVRGVVNVGTGQSASLLELIASIEAALGRTVEVRHLPAREADIPHSSMTPRRLREELEAGARVPLHDGIRLLMQHLRMRR